MSLLRLHTTPMAFCCTDNPLSISLEPMPIEKLKLKLYSFVEIYSISQYIADGDNKMRIYLFVSIAESPMLWAVFK